MDELEREQQYGDDEDDSYANAYLNDDENEDDDDENEDDDDLAAMFAKVKTIQQTEGIQPSMSTTTNVPTVPSQASAKAPPTLDVQIIQATAVQKTSTPTSARRSKSPSSAGAGIVSGDGIKTISRRTLGSSSSTGATGKGPVVRIDALLNVKKPAIYEDKLLQSVKSSDLLEKLKMKTAQAAPATIAKRIETLSEPAKKSAARKFATDDEERHCRFKSKKASGAKKESPDYDNDDGGSSANDRRNDFIARMEAAEKSKQKKLEMTRGENDYNARLDKKCCPKCTMPQSYSEWKEKKKRCQMCGVEFRVLQAWGDVGADFIARMDDATQAKNEKQEQIHAKVTQHETSAMRVKKTAKQQFYEKQMLQKNNHNSFLDRNYHNQSSSNGVSSSKAKQFQVQMQIQTQRAKMLASSCESPVI